MSSIIIATVPIHGHVTPLLTVARHFARARRPGPVRHRQPVRRGGAGHRRRAHPAARRGRLRRPGGPGRSRSARGSRARRRSPSTSSTSSCARAAPSTTRSWPRTADEPADALLTDPAFHGRRLPARPPPWRARPPIVVCGVVPLTIASRDTAPYGMGLTPLRGPVGRLRNALLSAVAARTVFPRAERLAGEVNHELHGRPLPFPVLDWPRHAEAIAQFTVPGVRVPTLRRPRDVALRRPALGHRLRGAAAFVVGRARRLAARRPRDPGHDREPRLPADHRPDARGASPGTTCWSSCPPVGARSTRSRHCPANARAATYLPYDELLPRTDVYVTNGGYGGVQYALRYGVPVVTSSGKEDKPEVAGSQSRGPGSAAA